MSTATDSSAYKSSVYGRLMSIVKSPRSSLFVVFFAVFAVMSALAQGQAHAATNATVNVRARGATGQEQIQLRIDGVTKATWSVTTTLQTYTYVHPTSVGASSLRVYFINNGTTSTGADKNVIIDYVDVNSQRFQTETSTTFSDGSWTSTTDCAPGYKSSEWLHCDGYMQYATGNAGNVTSPNSSVIAVNARGSTGQEQIQLRIDGVTYATWTLSTTAQTYTYTHPTSVGATSLRVYFVNNGYTSTGADKNAIIDYVDVKGVRFQTEAATTYSEGSWSSATGCNPGFKTSEWLQCDGYMQYSIGTSGGATAPGCNESQRVVAIVAHPDDELLFMNPDIDNKIQAGACVSAIYLTAGDAGALTGYATDRTYGAKSAWATMAGVNSAWSSSYLPVSAGQTQSVLKATLETKPGVHLYFLNAYEGFQDGSRPDGSMQKLWLNQITQLPTVEPLPSYTRQSLINTVSQLLVNERPAETYLMDTTNHKTMDHSDHTYGALFATQGVAGYKTGQTSYNYMGYANYTYQQNVSFNAFDRKMTVYHAYDKYDVNTHIDGNPSLSLYGLYRTALMNGQFRMTGSYPAKLPDNRVYTNAGILTGINGMCMDIENGSAAEGTIAQIWGCVGVGAQQWRISTQNQIVDNNGNCLDIRGPLVTANAKLEVWNCIDSNTQRWDRTSFNEIKLRNTNFCVTSSDDAGVPNSSYGNDLRLATCAHTAGQIWSYPPLVP